MADFYTRNIGAYIYLGHAYSGHATDGFFPGRKREKIRNRLQSLFGYDPVISRMKRRYNILTESIEPDLCGAIRSVCVLRLISAAVRVRAFSQRCVRPFVESFREGNSNLRKESGAVPPSFSPKLFRPSIPYISVSFDLSCPLSRNTGFAFSIELEYTVLPR